MDILDVLLAIIFSETSILNVTTARFDGIVYFKEEDKLPSNQTVDLLTDQAFKGAALNQLVIAFSNNDQLTDIKKVKLEGDSNALTNILNNNDKNSGGGSGLSLSMMMIIGGIGIGTVAVAIFSYLLISNKKGSQAEIVKNDTALSSPRSIDPENGQDFHDNQSDMTSVYSYIKDEGSVSIAPSYMYALNERSIVNDSDDDDAFLTSPAWAPGSPMRDPYKNNVRNGDDSNLSSPNSKSFVMTDDESSLISGADLEHALSAERVASPPKQSFTQLWMETSGDDSKNAIPQCSILKVSSPPRRKHDRVEGIDSSPLRVADDTRDWKVKYGISDELEIVDDYPAESPGNLSNVNEVAVGTESEEDVPEFLFQPECHSDDDVYATDDEADDSTDKKVSLDRNRDVIHGAAHEAGQDNLEVSFDESRIDECADQITVDVDGNMVDSASGDLGDDSVYDDSVFAEIFDSSVDESRPGESLGEVIFDPSIDISKSIASYFDSPHDDSILDGRTSTMKSF